MSSSMAEAVRLQKAEEGIASLAVAAAQLRDEITRLTVVTAQLRERLELLEAHQVLPTLHLPKKEHAKQ